MSISFQLLCIQIWTIIAEMNKEIVCIQKNKQHAFNSAFVLKATCVHCLCFFLLTLRISFLLIRNPQCLQHAYLFWRKNRSFLRIEKSSLQFFHDKRASVISLFSIHNSFFISLFRGLFHSRSDIESFFAQALSISPWQIRYIKSKQSHKPCKRVSFFVLGLPFFSFFPCYP